MRRALALLVLSLLVVYVRCFGARFGTTSFVTRALYLGSIGGINEKSPKALSFDGKSRANMRVRAIMDLLVERFDHPTIVCSVDHPVQGSSTDDKVIGDWSKMRRFLYRATADSKNPLTVSKVLKLLDFLNEAFPDEQEALHRSILVQSPRIVNKNVATRLRPTVDFLRSLYGPSLFVHAVTRNPDLLLTTGTGYRGDELDLVEVFLRQDLHLSATNIRQLKKSSPSLFQLSMVQLLSVVSYLRSILEVSTNPLSAACPSTATATIAKLILTHPSIFQLSVSENLQPRIHYFQSRLGLSAGELAGLIKSSSGAVLGLSVTRNLEPTLDLLSSLLPNASDLRKALASHSQILGLSLPNLQAKIDYLNQIDALTRALPSVVPNTSLASRVLLRSPTVFSLSLTDNIVPTVEFLARIWGTTAPSQRAIDSAKLSSIDISSLLSEYPSILTLSLEGNIQPTVNFYVRAGYLSLDEDGRLDTTNGRGTVVRGRYIAASLYTRLLPRWNFYCEQTKQEMPQGLNGEEHFAAPPLHLLAGTTDDVFCEKCCFDLSHYAVYKQQAIPRLKFSSQFDTWLHTGRPIDI